MAELADELLGEPPGSTDVAARALDRLRRRMDGTQAVVWVVTSAGVHRAVHVGDADAPVVPGEAVDGAMAIERLRRNATILCRAGDVSGVEGLVPAGVKSFLAASATRRGAVTGVLVLGWADAVPPCDETAAGHLRIAAALLTRTLVDADRASDQVFLYEAVLASLSDQITVVNRHGTIIAMNGAWTGFGEPMGLSSFGATGPGVSYIEVCRRAAAGGSPRAAAALEGIEAVCGGGSELFETAYPYHELGEERWYVTRVTPLRRPEGGAVIAHVDVTPRRLTELAERVGERRFRDLADRVPVPVWIVAPDGRLIYNNQAWAEASGGDGGRARDDTRWLEVSHPDDRGAAISAFRSSASRRERFDAEVRLQAVDGAYRWWSLAGLPRVDMNGRLVSYVGVCIDATAARRALRSLNEARAKLVTAQQAERSRIARELHDDLGQQLALLASRLDAVTHRREISRNGMLAALAAARKTLQDLATSIHNLSHELHPAKLKLLGLGPTLEILCRNLEAESRTHVSFDSKEVPSDVAEDSALCIFRVAQEALQNAVKHSGARHIDVHLTGAPSQLTLRVVDDGGGFDPLAPSAGLGLLTMRERVELLGGSLRIETGRSTGTRIEATVPLSSSAGGTD